MPHIDLTAIVKLIGYPGIFAIIFLESGVFFGFMLPGASLLFTAGLLASQGYFNPWILIPLVTIAAILGDNVGYWFGNKVGIKLFERQNSRFFKREHLHLAKEFYDKHGTKTILLGRWIPIIRTFAPIIAGIVAMRYSAFVFYNIFGALLWAAGVTTLGYVLGDRVPFVEKYLSVIILTILAVTTYPLVVKMWRQYRSSKAA